MFFLKSPSWEKNIKPVSASVSVSRDDFLVRWGEAEGKTNKFAVSLAPLKRSSTSKKKSGSMEKEMDGEWENVFRGSAGKHVQEPLLDLIVSIVREHESANEAGLVHRLRSRHQKPETEKDYQGRSEHHLGKLAGWRLMRRPKTGPTTSAPKDRHRAVAQRHGCHRHLLELTSKRACDTKIF